MAPIDRIPPVETSHGPDRPQTIKVAQRLVVAQAVVSLFCGFNPFYIMIYSFGFPIVWLFSVPTGDIGIGFLATLVVAPACGIAYATVLYRWIGCADRRAHPAVVVGTVVLVALVASYPMVMGWQFLEIALFTGAPSLVMQAVLLYQVFGPAGRRWFGSGGVPASSTSAGD
ncbi:hypothetical protein O1R50_00440 [Glycomyces luteolus]|uniref:Uncharacterized protein n=1 Tax=Glycomyces luteolus TaxID=2670330 RepID=A0A9X3P4E8_9ACTN|nr:hypothetical protein [Glycomyces luteolus]MDA1358072.1 hypothetical protein [Glycomyces luteolus]